MNEHRSVDVSASIAMALSSRTPRRRRREIGVALKGLAETHALRLLGVLERFDEPMKKAGKVKFLVTYELAPQIRQLLNIVQDVDGFTAYKERLTNTLHGRGLSRREALRLVTLVLAEVKQN